ncbi:GtrA family protein [Streptomyces sp. AC512_CC834]|uniref:GtrA family protein n=1 Tax=Streptomyces sp. AC512_CC834 TaxID=2823691 RepID=UPI0027E5AA97|nr:GtrA family protein [Streptomyces sp. AC512_CC834]
MARLKGASVAEPRGPLRPDVPRRRMWSREVGWFVAIGGVSTVGQALLYWGLRLWWPPAVANLVSLLVLTVLNTEANRRLTFRHAATKPARAHLGAGALFLLGYLVTSGAVLWFRHERPGASPAAETAVLAATSVAVTVVRFAVLRLAVFRGPERRRD